MSLELFGRLQQELSITGSAIYETVLALAERANRKVQVLRLHNQASALLTQIEQIHGEIGREIATLCARRPPLSQESTLPSDQLEHSLGQASLRIHQLKQTLRSVDGLISELKLETIHQELLTLQQDLSLRAAAIERLPVSKGSPVIGKSLTALLLPRSVRLVTILRGSILVPPDSNLTVRANDVLVFIGLQADLAQVIRECAPAPDARPLSIESVIASSTRR
jgi:K+/H+ antiporter YhaU regulatory subunit KhtT